MDFTAAAQTIAAALRWPVRFDLHTKTCLMAAVIYSSDDITEEKAVEAAFKLGKLVSDQIHEFKMQT